MDKRWIGIIVILIIGASCLYFVAESSNTVGSAIADVNKSIVTLPHDFSKGDSDSSSLYLVNKNKNESIYIKDFGKSDIALDEFESKLYSLSHMDGIIDVENTTNVTDDFSVYTIYYKNTTNTNYVKSISYVYKLNHTFSIKTNNFEDVDVLNEKLDFIVTTLQPDFKKSQD